jgi:FkbM family methyltransferase
MYESTFMGNRYRSITSTPYFGIEHENKAMERAWSLIKEDDIIFDIGAQYGVWTLPAAAAATVRKPRMVYAFEPYRPFFEKLKDNIKCNDKDIRKRITARCIGFDEKKRNNVPYSEDNVSTYLGNKNSNINVTTIDLFVSKNNNIEKVNHIKIDVDGPELNILKGGKETIKRFRPNIAIEEHNGIVPNISVAIYQFLVFDLRIPYSLESIPIFNPNDRTTFPDCRHVLYYI